MGILVDLAKALLQDAERLETQLNDASAPHPSFKANAPLTYPPESKHPEIFESRASLINKSKELHELALGPVDMLRYITGSARIQPYVLNVIQSYKIVDHVPKNRSISFENLASKLDVNLDVLQRIMRFAFSFRLFQEKPLGTISHTALSRAIPIYYDWTQFFFRDDIFKAFQAWPQSLKVYDEVAGAKNLPINFGNNDPQPFFDMLAADSDGQGMKSFSLAMQAATRVTGGADKSFFIQAFDWASLGSGPLIDVGGGIGHVATTIADAFPELRIIVQDLESNREAAEAQIPTNMKDRVTFQTQDFFQPQPRGLQPKAYYMKSILHDWNTADCVRLLSQLLPAVEKGAKIYSMDRLTITPAEGLVPSHHESMNQFMDLLMWTLLGAKERNKEQWIELVGKVDKRLKVLRYGSITGCDWGMLEIGML